MAADSGPPAVLLSAVFVALACCGQAEPDPPPGREHAPPGAEPRPADLARAGHEGVRQDRLGSEVAAPGPGQEERATPDARTGLQAAVRARHEGDLPRAVLVLRPFLDTATGADAALGCSFLALLFFEQVRYVEGLSALEGCEPPESLRDLVSYLRGEMLRGVGRPEEAVAQYEVVRRYHRSPLAPRAGFRVGDSLFEASQHSKALRQYGSMLAEFPEYPERHRVRFRMAVSRAELGETRKAASELFDVARTAPVGSDAGVAAQRALDALVARGVRRPQWTFEDELGWGTELRRSRRWEEALLVLRPLADEARSRASKGEVWFEVAKTLESLDFYQDALDALGEARKHGGPFAELLDARVRVLRKLGRVEEAVAIERERAGGNKKSMGLAAAAVYLRDGHYEKARALYARHLETKHDRGAQWKMAWLEYRTGRHDKAERRFKALVGKGGLGARMDPRYWVGRAQMKGGKKKEALRTFEEVARKSPSGYYGIMAANRILELGDAALYRELTGARPEHVPSPDDIAKAGARIRWDGGDGRERQPLGGPDRGEVAAELLEAAQTYGEGYPELWRALDRYRLGLDEAARLELRIAQAERKRCHGGSVRRLAQYAGDLFVDYRAVRSGIWGSSTHRRLRLSPLEQRREEKRIEAARRSHRDVEGLLERLMARAGDPYWQRRLAISSQWRTLRGEPTPATLGIFRQAYPLPFEEVLRREARARGLSPYLMGAIARVESGYNHLAISNAGALGLLQVMPVTGNLIAGRIRDTEFAVPDLLHPERSLSYGSWYMAELVSKFRGQEPLAIISYNCGPHRVQEWLARWGPSTELDELVEEVPYGQAKSYVKAVLGHVATYRRIYEDRADLYVGQKLVFDYRDNINW